MTNPTIPENGLDVSEERLRELLKLWASDNPSIEGSVYEGTYAQDVYRALLECLARRMTISDEQVDAGALAIWIDANGWTPPDAQDRKTTPWLRCRRQARAALEAALSLIEAERDKLREVLQKVRGAFKVEYGGDPDVDGGVRSVSYGSEALRPIITLLDAALHPTDNDHGDGR